jgi:hypothetical protein
MWRALAAEMLGRVDNALGLIKAEQPSMQQVLIHRHST